MELLAILLVVALLGGGGSSKPAHDDDGRELDPNDPPPTGDDMSNSGTPKARLWRQLEALTELDPDQRLFLMMVAKGESNFYPSAFNDSAGEAAAAGRAYDRIAASLAQCGRSRAAYATGSGGRFGRLVPYFVNDLRNLVPCIDPKLIGDGVHDIMSAIITARALQGYGSWRGTAGSLRAGWATPGWMASPPADKLAKWQRHIVEEKLDQGSTRFSVNTQLRQFPGPDRWPAMLGRLRQLA